MNLRMPQSPATETARARQRLERSGWPRLQMAAIVLVTAAVGLLASFGLRMAGIDSMVQRYPLAILAAYGIFLLQMWVWFRWREDHLGDVLEAGIDIATSSPGDVEGGWAGGGGSSGGGGGSGSWTASADSACSADGSVLDVADAADVEALPILAVLAILALMMFAVIAAGWVVWSAPVLMAELIVDGAIAGGLYRRMRTVQSQGWWWLCVRHTIWPLIGIIVSFAVFGAIVQYLVPDATTLMEGLRGL